MHLMSPVAGFLLHSSLPCTCVPRLCGWLPAVLAPALLRASLASTRATLPTPPPCWGAPPLPASWPLQCACISAPPHQPGTVTMKAPQHCPVPVHCSPPPASCADWATQVPGSQDGNYTLTLNDTSFTVYCYNMSTGSPLEYINVNSATNYAQDAGWSWDIDPGLTGADCDTYYSKVHLLPDLHCPPSPAPLSDDVDWPLSLHTSLGHLN